MRTRRSKRSAESLVAAAGGGRAAPRMAAKRPQAGIWAGTARRSLKTYAALQSQRGSRMASGQDPAGGSSRLSACADPRDLHLHPVLVPVDQRMPPWSQGR